MFVIFFTASFRLIQIGMVQLRSLGYYIRKMKSKSFNEQQTISPHMYQSGVVPQFLPSRHSHITRDYSNDQKIRRISPLPQDRFSQFSGNIIYPLSSYPPNTPNQYQLPIRASQQPVTSLDNKKSIQDMIARIQKLEMRCDKMEKIEHKIEKLDNSYNKIQQKIQKLQYRNEQLPQGNENRINLQNCGGKGQQQSKAKIKNMITRQQLQRQLIGLDSAFKTLIKQMKSNTNLEMREIHTKQKKAMIEVVASQISDKLEAFKANFISELATRIEKAVQACAATTFMSKNVIQSSKEKCQTSTAPVKFCQSLQYSSNGVQKSLKISQNTYFIDTQGYILDSSLAYLLDRNSLKIKLSEAHLDVLRKEGLLNISKEVYKGSKESTSTNFNEL